MEKMNDLKDLLKHEIDDLYSVEEQILEALPKMAEKASNKTLKTALSEHLRITEQHRIRLEKIRQTLNGSHEEGNEKKKNFLAGIFSGGQHVCKGMQGIIEEGTKIMKADMTPEVMDAAIIACAQKVEHYEICGYGTARTYARELQMNQEALLLEQTLHEEYEADDRLTALAIQRINLEAGVEAATSGDLSASGSAKGRAVREVPKERARKEEASMEPVSNKHTAEKSNTTSIRGGNQGTAAPRGSNARSSKTASPKITKASGKSTGSGSGGRSSQSGNRSR